MKPKPPCQKCEDRQLGCHDSCERYGAFRNALDEYKQKEWEQSYNEADAYLIEATIKRNK